MESLTNSLDSFSLGEISASIMLDKIVAVFPNEFVGSSSAKVPWNALLHILHLLPDPERRATLQLRYYYVYPQFYTHCCGVEHCFRCKTKW